MRVDICDLKLSDVSCQRSFSMVNDRSNAIERSTLSWKRILAWKRHKSRWHQASILFHQHTWLEDVQIQPKLQFNIRMEKTDIFKEFANLCLTWTCFRSVLIASACEISCAYSSLYELMDFSRREMVAAMSSASFCLTAAAFSSELCKWKWCIIQGYSLD